MGRQWEESEASARRALPLPLGSWRFGALRTAGASDGELALARGSGRGSRRGACLLDVGVGIAVLADAL
jgi:hypothetical protein